MQTCGTLSSYLQRSERRSDSLYQGASVLCDALVYAKKLDYSLNPSLNEGYVRLLYPQSPRHPRQKYLLTVKGLALYNEINKED